MNSYTIFTDERESAPPAERWQAAFHPLDEGESWFTSGYGPTELEAVIDLLKEVWG